MNAKIFGLLMMALLSGAPGVHAASIGYRLGVFDIGSPTIIGESIFASITPITGPATYTFEGSFALTSSDGVEAFLSPSGLPEFWRLSVFSPATIIDDVGGSTILHGAGPHTFTASGFFDCGALGGCVGMQLDFLFLAGGGTDAVLSTGTFSLEPASVVPEPGTLTLLSLGLAGLVLATNARRIRQPLFRNRATSGS